MEGRGRKLPEASVNFVSLVPGCEAGAFLIVAMACYFHVSTDYLLMGKDHDKVDSRTKLLDVVVQLTEIAKRL